MDPLTRGDPTSLLRGTCKRRAKIAATLAEQGWWVSASSVRRMLRQVAYRLQSARKLQNGATHPDRNVQIEHVNAAAEQFLSVRREVG